MDWLELYGAWSYSFFDHNNYQIKMRLNFFDNI